MTYASIDRSAVCQSICPSVSPPICLSVYLSIHLKVPTYLPITNHPPICLLKLPALPLLITTPTYLPTYLMSWAFYHKGNDCNQLNYISLTTYLLSILATVWKGMELLGCMHIVFKRSYRLPRTIYVYWKQCSAILQKNIRLKYLHEVCLIEMKFLQYTGPSCRSKKLVKGWPDGVYHLSALLPSMIYSNPSGKESATPPHKLFYHNLCLN
jgi:hypothetical protein